MIVLNKTISLRLHKLGLRRNSFFVYVKYKNISRLCINSKIGYMVVSGNLKSKIIKHKDTNISNIYNTYTLSELNDIIKFYHRYFIIDYDYVKNKWIINKSIFKIYFMDIDKRKYIKDFDIVSNKEFDNEVDAIGELIIFLVKSKFINIDDINNFNI